jgi:hypothetical protein
LTHRLAALNGAALPCVKHETKTKHGAKKMDYESELFQIDYHNGWLVIRDKETNKQECVQLTNNKGRNITLNQFKSGIKSHGLDKACKTFLKLAATYKPTAKQVYA